ncbi:MAG: hypothetical protein H6Q89_2946 [Myxococcaceae bacterium]|nr:hypothetical protein [Myxococcaceae bacterium]
MRTSLVLAVSLVCVGCAAHRATGPLEVLPESARDLARQLGRPTYGEPMQPLAESVELAQAVLAGVPLAQRSRVLHEPALDAVASLIAHVWDDEQRDLADSVVEQLVWHAGVPATFAGYARATADGYGSTDFLTRQLHGLRFEPTESYAFGVARLDSNPKVQIVVLAVRDLQLDAMPKLAAPGSKIVLQGRIEGSFEDLRLLVSDGPAQVRTVEFVPGSDGRFRIELDAPTTAGSHLFEWTGEDLRGWRATLLAVPLFIGSQAPTMLDLPLASEVPNPPELAAWEGVVRERVNALRAQQQLPPTQPHPALAQLAAQQAKRHADNPLAPPDPLFDALNASGLRTRDAFQYRGVTHNLRSRIDRALARPSVREQVLRPGFTRMSVAFSADPKGGWSDAWLLSEALGPFDGRSLASQLLAEVNRRRKSKGVGALNPQASLDALAQTFADKSCAGAADAVASLEADARKVKGLSVRGYQIYTAPVLVPSLMRGDKSDSDASPLRTPQTQAGVGACERGKPGTAGNELAVFVFADLAAK